MLQIDALAYAELRRAIELGYCPTIEQMVREQGYTLRRWFCGLPSATPYCQAGFFHGENDGIPAFRFYDKSEQRVITCNTPAGVQYIRDRITAPGALAGGSSYVNLLDGDAQNVAFTVATRDQASVFKRLGGWRMAMLMLIHPIRVLRMGAQAALEWLREDYERSISELTGRRTHSEGLFPFIRVLTSVVVRELQTMAILLDVYSGVPVIYSTFMQYDELGHHFGPASFQALRDLRRTDARIREIRRMIANAGGREYDLVILSDHGMTPSVSYRVRFGETLGTTIEHVLQRDAARTGERPLSASTSFAQDGEYADMSARVVDAVAEATPERHRTVRGILLRARDWVRSRYGLRELILPEKYRVEAGQDVVVTYSSDLALLYFADDRNPLDLDQIAGDNRRAALYDALLDHPGVGLLAARSGTSVHVESSTGRAILADGAVRVLEGANPLEPYGTSSLVIRALERLVWQPNTGDLTIFGAYDGYEIVSFDDQIGAHGAAGGNQLHPFLIGPPELQLEHETIDDPRDIHRVILAKYMAGAALAFACVGLGGARASLHAQQATRRDTTGVIAGRVIDAEKAEPRAGTTISIVGTTRGTLADADGRFVISAVAPGDRTIRAHILGYATLDRAVVVRAGDTTRVELRLEPEAQVLSAVKTEAKPIDRELFDSRPAVGTVQLTARAAEGVPRLGDPDVMRIVQLLPGVEARNDFSTGFNVRGGEADQNLILLDGYPIYNPFHLGGLFSTFIDPTVGDITLMTGGFPARYGSRLSSVLDVSSAEETRAGLHGTAELSLLSSTGELGGSFDSGKATWMIAGRRTYADEFVKLISSDQLPYHFRDEQAHFSYAFSPSTRLTVTAYDGRDILNADIASFSDSTGTNASGGSFLFDWGNTVVGATLATSFRRPNAQWLFGDSATAEQHASRSRFSTALNLGAGSLILTNAVNDTRLGGSITAHSASNDRTLGYDAATYTIDYGASSPQTETQLYGLHQRPTSGALFLDDLWRPSSSWLVETGLRGEAYAGAGLTWLGLSPRVSAKYFVTPELAFTAAVGKFTQGMHSLAREDIPVRLFDFWVASDSVTPVSSAWHFVTGGEKWFGTSRYVRVEGFYKKYGSLLDANPSPDPDNPSTNFFSETGESYGADVLLREFERGPFSGWISYTYTVSTRQVDSISYFPGQDRRHDFNFVANWRAKRYLIGLRFGYATGTPYTDIVGEIVRRIYDPGLNAFGTRGGGPQNEFIGGPRDGARLPPTQRLDLSVTRTYSVRGTSIAPYLSVVNAYDAKNVFLYVFDYAASPPTKQAISQFPLLPSAGVSIHF